MLHLLAVGSERSTVGLNVCWAYVRLTGFLQLRTSVSDQGHDLTSQGPYVSGRRVCSPGEPGLELRLPQVSLADSC